MYQPEVGSFRAGGMAALAPLRRACAFDSHRGPAVSYSGARAITNPQFISHPANFPVCGDSGHASETLACCAYDWQEIVARYHAVALRHMPLADSCEEHNWPSSMVALHINDAV